MSTQFSDDELVAITLSAIAYKGVDSTHQQRWEMIREALQLPGLPTQGNWSLVWGPHEKDQFLVYIVQGPRTQFGRKYAVVIRGTVKSVYNIYSDLDDLGTVPLPWNEPKLPGAAITDGVDYAWNRVKTLTEKRGGKDVGIVDFLKSVDTGSLVLVTGHSLGGQLASAFASWLRSELNYPKKRVGIQPITFAGPTAGNAAFADPYQGIFKTGKRFQNDFDIIPRLWAYDDIKAIKSLYPGSSAPKCDDINGCRELADVAMDVVGHQFKQTGGQEILKSKLYSDTGMFEGFYDEAEAQHSALLYMWLMGFSTPVVQSLYPKDKWKPPA